MEAYTLWKCNVCVRPELNLTAKWTKYLKDLLPTTLNISSWTCALTNVSVRIVNKARVLTGDEFNYESFIMSHCTHSSDLILLLLFSWCCRAKVSCHHLSLFCFCLFFFLQQISGNCNTTVLHTPEGYSYLYSYDCTLVPGNVNTTVYRMIQTEYNYLLCSGVGKKICQKYSSEYIETLKRYCT